MELVDFSLQTEKKMEEYWLNVEGENLRSISYQKLNILEDCDETNLIQVMKNTIFS